MRLKPDEFGAVVFCGEAGGEFLFVLKNAFAEVAGDAEVDDARLAGHEVDVVGAVHCGGLWHGGVRGVQREVGETAFDGHAKPKRDFSLRKPTHSQERM